MELLKTYSYETIKRKCIANYRNLWQTDFIINTLLYIKMDTIITLTQTEYVKNKNTYVEVSKEVKEIFEKEYFLTTNDNTIKYFKRLGGRETVTRGYTCAGFKIVKLVSTSPDKETKIVREFNFKTI